MAKMVIKHMLQSPSARVMISALASAITWFLWAWWANRGDGHQALVSGLSQGGVSFITTSIGSLLLEFLFARLGSGIAGMAGSVMVVSSLSLSFMLSVHLMANTPNILLTIAPVYAVVLVFCSSYVVGLKAIQQKNEFREVESTA